MPRRFFMIFGITPGMISIMSGRKVSSIFWVLATAIESMIKARRIPNIFSSWALSTSIGLVLIIPSAPVCSFIKSIATSLDPSPWTRSACTMAHFPCAFSAATMSLILKIFPYRINTTWHSVSRHLFRPASSLIAAITGDISNKSIAFIIFYCQSILYIHPGNC